MVLWLDRIIKLIKLNSGLYVVPLLGSYPIQLQFYPCCYKWALVQFSSLLLQAWVLYNFYPCCYKRVVCSLPNYMSTQIKRLQVFTSTRLIRLRRWWRRHLCLLQPIPVKSSRSPYFWVHHWCWASKAALSHSYKGPRSLQSYRRG